VKIGKKLVGSFIVVACVCGIVGGIGYRGLIKTGQSINEIGVVRLPSVEGLLIIRAGGTEIATVQRTLLNLRLDHEARQEQLDRLREARLNVDKGWQMYEPLPQTAEEAKLWQQFVPIWHEWQSAGEDFFELTEQIAKLDLGDPTDLCGKLDLFRGDHYHVEQRVLDTIVNQTTFDGGDDPTACNFGKWLTHFESDNPQVQQLLQAMHESHNHFHQAVGQAKQLVADADSAAATAIYREEMKPASEQVFHHFSQLREVATEGQRLAQSAYEHSMIECRDLQHQAFDLLDQIVDLNVQLAADAVATGQSSAAASKVLAIVAVTVGVLLALGFGIVISRAITRPVRTMVDRLKDIAEGEGDLTQRVTIHSHDEIGELARWFNTFVQKVHDIIADVACATREVAGAATEIAAASEEMASGMNEQNQQVTQISSAIEEMSASVVEVAAKAGQAAGAARDSGSAAEQGGQVVHQTIAGMDTINEAVTAGSQSVLELGRRNDQIGQIVEVINDIADQTNLLALNAAIEAARAGEHGRGFAVVADEVRKLADRTTTATDEIAQSISAIQGETRQAVARMEAGTEQVDAGVKLAQQAGDALRNIVGGAKTVAELISSIAAAAEQQSSASEQISHNVESILAVTNQSTQGASQAAAAATQLSTKAEQLQQLVGQFKLASSRAA
jgi:methyl-accepting chemotaxis protein